MPFEQILYTKERWRATISLNRAAKLNALTDEMMAEIRTALADAEADADVRVVVIRGEGRAFSAGFDVSPRAVPRTTTGEWRAHFRNGNATMAAIWNSPKAVVAQVHGACLGGAFDMTMACDLVICSDDAFFGEPEVRFGGTSMYLLLPWLVGMRTAKQILLTGENINAQAALRLQIVNEVVPMATLDDAVQTLCRKLAKVPAGTLPLNKRALNRSYELMGMRETVQYSEELAILAITDLSTEAQAFEEKAHRDGLKAAIAWRDAQFE